MKHIFILVFVCLIHNATATIPSYSDIVALDAECTPRDTCQGSGSRGRRLLSPRERNCGCDQICTQFNDCCVDSPFSRKEEDGSLKSRTMSCRETELGSFYMKNKCPSDWTDDTMRDLCEKEAPVSDPLRQLPVTDTSSGITYKNSFCAQCDNINQDLNRLNSLIIWNSRIECPNAAAYNSSGNVTEEYVWKISSSLRVKGVGDWSLIIQSTAKYSPIQRNLQVSC